MFALGFNINHLWSLKMKEDHDLFFSGDWNKFFGWEFVLWEAGIPIYIGTSQLVFIGGYFSIRTVILAQSKN